MALKDYLPKSSNVFFEKNWKLNSITLKKVSFIIYFSILTMSFLTYSVTYNYINNQKKNNEQNLEKFFSSQEFKNVKSSILSNVKSPYIEFNYNIEVNDSIGKILRKFKVPDNEIQKIIEGLKKRKLTNIYAGRELNIVLKRVNENENSIINILYPINNTLNVKIKKKKRII